MTELRLALSSATLSDAVLQERARSLATDVERTGEAHARTPTGRAVENAKGEPITVGVLLVTLMTSGTAVAVFEVVKAYLQRDRGLEVTVTRPDGTSIAITAKDAEDMASGAEFARRMLGEDAET